MLGFSGVGMDIINCSPWMKFERTENHNFTITLACGILSLLDIQL